MSSSRVLKLLLVVALALLLTIPAKVGDYAAVRQSQSRNLQNAIVAMLASQGFEIETGDILGSFVVNARHGECQLQVREAPAQGYNVSSIENASKDARLSYEYNGELWQTHPTLRATVSEIWNRFKWHLWIDNSWSPVVSVAARGRCATNALPWQNIAKVRGD